MSMLQQTPGNKQTNLFISSLRGEPKDAISENECQTAQVKEKVKKTYFLRWSLRLKTYNQKKMILSQGGHKEETFQKIAMLLLNWEWKPRMQGHVSEMMTN